MASSNMMTPESSTMLSGPVGIVWDIENCCVPGDVNPEDVAGNIQMALRVHPVITGAVKSFSAFGDFSGFRRELREGCQRTGVKLVDVPNGRKDAADKAMLIDMFLFALDNPPPSSILLISGDVDFAPALHILGQRGYTVILVIPAGVNVSSALTNAGRFVWDWPSVARGEGFIPPRFPIPRVPSLVKNVKGREEDIPVDIRICRSTSSSFGDFSDEKKIEMVENYGSSGTMDCQTQKEQTFPQNPERSNLYQKTQNPYQNPISKNSGTSPENSNSQSAKIKPRPQEYRNLTAKIQTPNQPKTQKYHNFPESKKDQSFTIETTKIPKNSTKTPNWKVVKQKEKEKQKVVGGSGKCSRVVGGSVGETIQTQHEQNQIYPFSIGWDPSCEVIKSQILMVPELPNFATITNLVQHEETQKKTMTSNTNSTIPDNQAFIAGCNQAQGNNYNNRKRFGNKANEHCENCKKEGHNKNSCWFLFPHLRPPKNGDKNAQANLADGSAGGRTSQPGGGGGRSDEPNPNPNTNDAYGNKNDFYTHDHPTDFSLPHNPTNGRTGLEVEQRGYGSGGGFTGAARYGSGGPEAGQRGYGSGAPDPHQIRALVGHLNDYLQNHS